MVGLGGLEPPTSRLSSARSNQLSYKPDFLQRGSGRALRCQSADAPGPERKARPKGKRNEDGGVPHFWKPKLPESKMFNKVRHEAIP